MAYKPFDFIVKKDKKLYISPYSTLTKKLKQDIENMGIDHHMEEILRIQDQINMSDNDFQKFLLFRGYDKSLLETTHKGEKDIILNTGPHLGDLNQPKSVPELIEFLFCLSSLCVSDRFIMENGLKACRN